MTDPERHYPDSETPLLVCPTCFALVSSNVDADFKGSDMERHLAWHDREAGGVAVWRFARDFARPSGDSPSCECVNCRAYRAVRADEGTQPSGLR